MVSAERRDLASLPKAHLHLHFTGSMRHGTLVELGALRCGQCPMFSMMLNVLLGMCLCMYQPTGTGAMRSSLHCRISVGLVMSGSRERRSVRNVTRANCLAISGSVRQKLFVSS